MSGPQTLYGLTVDADYELYQDRDAPPGTPTDLRIISEGELERDAALPDGEVLLHLESENEEPMYSAIRTPTGVVHLRFHGSCNFEISPDLGTVHTRRICGADPGIVSVLTTGGLLAFQLYLRGATVLHASAVDVGGRAVAFLGGSGMGKSTMAALMCAGGATLVTDDVLRVDFPDPGPGAFTVRLGATELRLRKGADQLIDRFEAQPPGARTSADGRQVLRLSDEARDHLPLSAIVVPMPMRDSDELRLSVASSAEALNALLNFPRLLGWKHPATIHRHIGQLTRIADRVPLIAARVPWGPPFDPQIASLVRAEVDELAAGLDHR